MKEIFSAFSFLFLSFNGSSKVKAVNSETVSITFYNNSQLPQTFSFISYAPRETGNGTYQVVLKPYAKSEQKYIPGTKLYLADKKHVDIVMSGKKLEAQPLRSFQPRMMEKQLSLTKNNDDK